MKKQPLIALGLAVSLVALGIRLHDAKAGYKTTPSVQVSDTWYGCTARGSLGAARNSANDVEFISMRVTHTVGANNVPTLILSARDAQNEDCSCQTTDPKMVDLAASLNPDSYISFSAGGSSCMYLEIATASSYEPKL